MENTNKKTFSPRDHGIFTEDNRKSSWSSFPVKQCWEAESTAWIQGNLLLTWQYCWWCGFGVEIFQFSSCTVDCVTGWQCCIVKTSISSTRNRPGSWDYANKLHSYEQKKNGLLTLQKVLKNLVLSTNPDWLVRKGSGFSYGSGI